MTEQIQLQASTQYKKTADRHSQPEIRQPKN